MTAPEPTPPPSQPPPPSQQQPPSLPPPTAPPAARAVLGDEVPERRLHPLSPVVTAMFGMMRAWPIVLIAFARGALALLVGLALVLLVWRFLTWLRTSYEIGREGLVVRSGILWRTTQVVPPQRVQQVEVRRQLRHQALGLAVVRVGLAGAGGTGQVELDALSVPDAEQLGARLERWRSSTAPVELPPGSPLPPPSPGSTPSGPPATLLAIPLGQLVVAGLTSRSLWLAPLAALAAAVQFMVDAGVGTEPSDAVITGAAAVPPAVLITGVMLFALAVASVSTVVSHYGLVVHRAGDDVVVRRGLLEKRSVTVPRRRVQYVVVSDNVVRRRFGLAALDARTADLGGGGDDVATSSTSIPIGRRTDLDELVAEFLPGLDRPATHRHPPNAVRRSVVRRSVRVVPATALVGLLVAGVSGVPIAATIGLVVGVVGGWLAGRRLRTGWDDGVIVTERGVVGWRRSVVPVGRVQSAAVLQNPFQRRLGLATVRLDVAGSVGGVTIVDLDVDEAWRIRDRAVGWPAIR